LRTRLVTKLLLAAAATLVAPGLASRAAALGAGHPSPDCRLGALGTSAPRALSALRGQVVYVDFWASWCTACAASFPMMNALQRDLGSRGLQVVAVNVDERAADALGFLEAHAPLFAVGADPQGQCAERFEVNALPWGFLIDRRGVVRLVLPGHRERDAGELRRAVEGLLAEPGGP